MQQLLRICFFSLCISQASPLLAQKAYFQQEVNFTIQAVLNDTKHEVTGRVDFEYSNNSPDTLSYLWIHLWPNAYRNRRTELSKDLLREGNAKFYFAPDSLLGSIRSLDFTADGRKATLKLEPGKPDVARLDLPQPLPPGGKVLISTPYLLRVPGSFSRLGHVGQSYQITQWFPKPAVYDAQGWHPMPYLNQGEFYSEFGSFDVTLTLPENYVVGATGVLQTESEQRFINQEESRTRALLKNWNGQKVRDTFPASSTQTKTLRFRAERVHDFAWFADKRFLTIRDTALVGDKQVVCTALFLPSDAEIWKKGAFYVKRAVEFYSANVGDYPYPQATAIHSALSAGAGMEYPMITVIGDEGSPRSLDNVITHEVGHNWFYGILASNERDHAWMDEGFNTYYENRYMKTYYNREATDDMLPPRLFNPSEYGSLGQLAYQLLAREKLDAAINSPSNAIGFVPYGIQSYTTTASALRWLERAEGRSRFDAAMKDYYRQWQFRHPRPQDVYAVLKANGLKADWFFYFILTGASFDLRLEKVSAASGGYMLEIRNKGDLNAPFPITALAGGKAVDTIWVDGLKNGKAEVFFPITQAVDAFAIDYERSTLDVRRMDNMRRTHGLLPGIKPLSFKLFAPIENDKRSVLAGSPWFGWNKYDKFMLGATFYNAPMPTRRLQYLLAPGFGFGSKDLVGMSDLRLRLYPGGLIPKMTIGLGAKTFNFEYNDKFDYDLKYYRLAPEVRLELRDRSTTFRHNLNIRALFIGKEKAQFEQQDTVVTFTGKSWKPTAIYEFRYEGKENLLPNPFKYTIALETQRYDDAFDQQQNYTRLTAEWQQKFYYKAKRKITARFFGGYFLQNTKRESSAINSDDLTRGSLALTAQGYSDYRFDYLFLGRSETNGFLARQITNTDGGFKNAFGVQDATAFGNSNNYLATVNVRADLPLELPLGLPLKPYFDFGVYDAALPDLDREAGLRAVWSGGLLLEFLDGAAEVYFPLINSAVLQDKYCGLAGGPGGGSPFCGRNFWDRITWSISFNQFMPESFLENLLRPLQRGKVPSSSPDFSITY